MCQFTLNSHWENVRRDRSQKSALQPALPAPTQVLLGPRQSTHVLPALPAHTPARLVPCPVLLASLVLNPVNQPSVGASGALFGLFGAFAVAGKRIGADVRSIYVIIGINFAISFVIPNVDWHAHLGGLLGGALTAWILLQVAKRR